MKIITTPIPDGVEASSKVQAASGKDHVRHATEGTDPKTGQKMLKTDLTGCHTAQQVWFSPASRVALPIKE